MESIINITEKEGKQTVSARELHEKLGVSTKFADWFKRMCEYGFEENTDYTTISSVLKNENDTSGTNNVKGIKGFQPIEYHISLDMAKHICMIQRSELGMKFRNYFIECEKALLQKLEEEKQYLKTRAKSKAIRNMFTDVLESHGYKKPYEYIQTTKQMKNALGITNKKNEMTERELQLVLASETLSSLTLDDEQGFHEVNPVCVDVSKSVIGLIANTKHKKQLIAL